MIAHNGEINALRGNVNWIRAREHGISSTVLGEDLEKIWPLNLRRPVRFRFLRQCLGTTGNGRLQSGAAMMMLIPKPGQAIH